MDVRTIVSILCVCTALWSPCSAVAQEGTGFRARLSVLPVNAATFRTITGTGSVTAALEGDDLLITGTFEGLSSRATSAHIHRAPKGRRGPVVFPLSVTNAATGELGGTVVLSDSQVHELNQGHYYVQIHTETNPEGEIRGWLSPQEF